MESSADPPLPRFSREEAADIALRLFGVRGDLSPLPADRDQNFRLVPDDGEAFVLKIFQRDEDPAVLECQDEVMERLAQARLPYRFPRVLPTVTGVRTGEVTATAEPDAAPVRHLVRMVEWVPGVPLARADSRTLEMEAEIGRLMGAMDRVLAGYDHPAAHRDFEWDLRRAGQVVDLWVGEVGSAQRLVLPFRELFRSRVEPVADRLPTSVIHGDGNDHNILVGRRPGSADHQVVGLVDFGDLIRSWRVAEPAVAAAYALLDREDPLGSAARVAKGYHQELPLTAEELTVFFPLATMRLCVSVVQSARRAKERPEDPYLRVSEAPAWRALRYLSEVEPDRAEEVLRRACEV